MHVSHIIAMNADTAEYYWEDITYRGDVSESTLRDMEKIRNNDPIFIELIVKSENNWFDPVASKLLGYYISAMIT